MRRRSLAGDTESIYQPGWSPDGTLYYVSDRDGWWRLYTFGRRTPVVDEVAPADAEFGRPQWMFRHIDLGDSRIRRGSSCAYTRRGRWRLGLVDAASGECWRTSLPSCSRTSGSRPTATHAAFVAGSDDQARCGGPRRSAVGQPSRRFARRRPGARRRVSLDRGSRSNFRRAAAGLRTRSTMRLATRTSRHRTVNSRRSSSSAMAGRRRRREPPRSISQIQYWTSRGFARRRRELRRQLGVWPRVSRAARMGSGEIVDVATTSITCDVDGSSAGRRRARRDRRGRLDHSGRQRRRLHDAGRADLSAGCLQGGRKLLRRSATSRCSRSTRTSSNRAISDGLIGPYPEARERLSSAIADSRASTGWRARSFCFRASRTRSCHPISLR